MSPTTTTILHTAAAGFEAARHLQGLPGLPPGHKATRLHGHSFEAALRCALPDGWAPCPGAEVPALREALQGRVELLDHHLLNEQVPEPSDAGIARWLLQGLQAQGVPGIRRLALRSAPRQGVVLQAGGALLLWRRHVFQSAHQLPHVPAGHKCGRMHGHGFEVLLHAAQSPGAGSGEPAAIRHDAIDAAWAPLQAMLDGACLNDIPGLHNPTSELLSAWIWQQLQPRLPQLRWVTVYETASCGAMHDGRDFRIWKEFSLDSAVRLQRAPAGHALRRLHGHTYTLRLHLHAPLDAVLGWAVDFGDVKTLFQPLFQQLDHQPLHELPGLADADCASLAHWVLAQARAQLPALCRVDLMETPGCGAIALHGDDTSAAAPL